MEGLGNLFDVGLAFAPVDTQSAAITGKRISMVGATGCTILVIKAAGTADDDPVFDLQQHTAYTSGTTADLDIIDHYYWKSETALDNDESWAEVTQTAASEVTGSATSAEVQAIYAFEVHSSQLSDGYTHISLNVADTGSAGAQLAAGIYILHGLLSQRTPPNLGNLLRPGAANA